MIHVTGRRLAAFLAIGMVLTACEDGQFMTGPGTGTAGDGEATVVPAAARTELREVERSDIFGVTELALWDGRPSLGGVWVAHPDVADPERARIVNRTNGQTITGALFRRERQNPGPRIQVSSDAAAALGMLAGQPTELQIVVLRTEEIVIAPPPPPEPAEPEPEDAQDDTAAAAVAAGAGAGASVAATPPRPRGFFARLFGPKEEQPLSDIDPGDDIGAEPAPEVETATLDDPIAAASAAIDEAEAEARVSAAPAVIPAPAAAPAPAPAAGGLANPFVQVGLFSVEANADAAAANLRQNGIVPTVTPGQNANGTFWRVIVGPMTSTGDQAEMLGQIRSLGYQDAFLTAN